MGYHRPVASRIAVAFVLSTAALASTALSACKSDSKPAIDASTGGEAGACGGTTAYLATCTLDSECQSCLCHSFGHSIICTKTCMVDGDCPAPSGGCTLGFCRP